MDSENTHLHKIAKSVKAIEYLLGQQPPPSEPLPDNMNVTVTNFPAVQEVSVNNLPQHPGFPNSFDVGNFPVSFQVSNFPSGFAVTNFPASFQVSNFPTDISVNNFPAGFQIAGTVSVDNFPVSIVVSNFPVTQAVAVNNFPATQSVSAVALPLPTGASTEATLNAILARLGATNYGKTVNYTPVNQGAAGTLALAAASPGNRHKVVGFLLTLAANGTVQFLSNATALTGLMDILARGNLSDPVSVLEPSFQTAVGEALNLTSVGGGAKGFVAYLTEP